jgi:hypothetical protein
MIAAGFKVFFFSRKTKTSCNSDLRVYLQLTLKNGC